MDKIKLIKLAGELRGMQARAVQHSDQASRNGSQNMSDYARGRGDAYAHVAGKIEDLLEEFCGESKEQEVEWTNQVVWKLG